MYQKIFKLSLLTSLVSISLFSYAQQLNNINKPNKTVPNMAPAAVPKTQFQQSSTPLPNGPSLPPPTVTTGPGAGVCTAGMVTWGSNACSGPIGAGTQMQNASVVNTQAEATGTGNFACVNGNWVPAAGSICTPTVRTCQLFDINGSYLTKLSESTSGTTTTANITYTPASTGTNTALYRTSIPHLESTVRAVMCTPGTDAQMEKAYIAMRNQTGQGLWNNQTYGPAQSYGVGTGYGLSLCSMAIPLNSCGTFSVFGTISNNGVHNLTCTYVRQDCSGAGE